MNSLPRFENETGREECLLEAEALEEMLPRIVRCLFGFNLTHPASELPVAQLRICSLLRDGPRSMTSLSEELGIVGSAITQIADRMEKAGLVERVLSSRDRRCRKLRLSPQGQEWMESRRQLRIGRVTEALSHLDPALRSELLKVLLALLDAANAMPVGGAPAKSDELHAAESDRSAESALLPVSFH